MKKIAEDIVLENKYEEEYNIIPQDIVYYEFVKSNVALKGIFGLKDITINLYYQQKEAQLKVKYIDDRNKILKQKVLRGKYGESYITTQEEFAGYIFERVEGEPMGIYDENSKDVVYYYDRVKTKVTIKHYKKDYNKKDSGVLVDDIVIVNKYDEEYNHQPQDIINHEFIESDRELSGKHGLEDIEINLFYQHKDSQVIVKYVDDRNKILDEVTISGKLGESYISESKDFIGYIFDNVVGDVEGLFKDEYQEVVYKYDRVKSKVIFKYICYDKRNVGSKVIADDFIIENKYEEKYQHVPQIIPNYEFIYSEGALEGQHGLDDQIIFLIYKHVDTNITNPNQNNNSDNTLQMLPVTGNQYLNIGIILMFTIVISSLYLYLKRIS